MTIVEEVRRDREDLARVLKKHTGIRRIVEELYPDSAHFIYELLQNAEDASATEAVFTLLPTNLVFEHNGRPFDRRDILGITDIGDGGKANDDDKIGRFGVGFKAVFAYTETPHIWSPTFSFKITDLVLPCNLDPRPNLDSRTRFEFPFNNPKKAPDVAYAEVKTGLEDLPETTLLFLSNLRMIRWNIGTNNSGVITRHKHSQNHVEVRKEQGPAAVARSHFLRFEQPVIRLEKQRVAAAFALERLPDVEGFDPGMSLKAQLKIVAAEPGRVAVFFPADKETSGLRFHLHGPFVPELSRASIKETPSNDPLFQQLETLVAKSLHYIRDIGLLTVDFLGVLPNKQDQIPSRYEGIRSAIIEEMNSHPVTPTHYKGHAPAKRLLQAKAAFKTLLSEDDIALLVDQDRPPLQWAAGAGVRHSNADRFLSSLAITNWDVEQFVKLLTTKTRVETAEFSPPYNVSSEHMMKWLDAKPSAWHQSLYAILWTFLENSAWHRGQFVKELSVVPLVLLRGGGHSAAIDCFFPPDDGELDEGVSLVDERVYASGGGEVSQVSARRFLEEIGVRKLGEMSRVQIILNERYTHDAKIPDDDTYSKDLDRFVSLVEKDPDKARLFGDHYIFACRDNGWRVPRAVFLDRPFMDTGLAAYFSALGGEESLKPLSKTYLDFGVLPQRLIDFCIRVGVSWRLPVMKVSCASHPAKDYLMNENPRFYWNEKHGIDEDYTIPKLRDVLSQRNEEISRLVWQTLSSDDARVWLLARYRKYTEKIRERPSQLVYLLRDIEWVPQMDGSFVRPAEASRDLLPAGFAFDSGWPWLTVVRFGTEIPTRSKSEREKDSLAKELGFPDTEALEVGRWFARLPPEERGRIRSDWEGKKIIDLPEHLPTNPSARAQHVKSQAATAPERTTEERTRSVSLDRDKAKEQTREYLRAQYTSEGDMICQMCHAMLPFKLSDGSDYFEAVEFLPTLNRRYFQNYLTLCPNHAAMFQYANDCESQLLELFNGLTGVYLDVMLAQRRLKIYFTETHIADLRAVVEADGNL